MWSHGLSWNYFLVCIFVLDISDFRYRGVKMCLFEALMRVSKFIKKILSCSEDTNKMQAEFARERECTQPSNIRIQSHLDGEFVTHFNKRRSKYSLPPAQLPNKCPQEYFVFGSSSLFISIGNFF